MQKLVLTCMFLLSTFLAAQNVEVGFSARGTDPTARNLVLKVIASSKTEIRIAAYNFTDRSIIEELIKAEKRGVDVRVVHDYKASREKGDATGPILASGGKVRLNRRYAIMHDKFIVVDGVTVETGSFNFSKNAWKENAENVLVLWNAPAIAARYLKTWMTLWDESK